MRTACRLRRGSFPLFIFALFVALRTSGFPTESALLAPAEKKRLVDLIHQGGAAQKLFAQLRTEADAARRLTPHPIITIQTEGKLAHDPAKVATQAALKDMQALWVLGYVFAVTNDADYAHKARDFIVAWARTNHPTGEPIDDTNLEPLIVAYDLTRDTFSPEDQKSTDTYLRALVDAEWSARQVTNNWQSHRLKIVGLAAYVLHDEALIARALDGFKTQVAANLNADGSSFDFQHRDALHYHVYDLEPLLTLAIAAEKQGVDLYDFSGSNGASLRQSVHFLLPYCTGEKQHREWVNSKVKFDRARAENGQPEFEIGHLFQPEQGFKALALAAYFDRSVDPVVEKLSRKNTSLLAAWTLLLSATRVK